MKLIVQDQELLFLPVRISFQRSGITDLFAHKNNKTLAETIQGKKYSALALDVQRLYASSLSEPLGRFLYRLKRAGDTFYLRFLNKYGDSTYCNFSIADHRKVRGLYSFVVQDKIKYIGRSHDPFEKRISQGYGNISPKNCYRDGQATNCHLNSLIAVHYTEIELFIHPMVDDAKIDYFERILIRQYQPEWNISLKNEGE